MIVFQFALSVIFIASAGILRNQFGHLWEADMGYNRDRVAVIQLGGEAGNKNVMLVKYSSSDRFPELRKFMKAQWKDMMPDLPFECMTLTEYSENVFGLLFP